MAWRQSTLNWIEQRHKFVDMQLFATDGRLHQSFLTPGNVWQAEVDDFDLSKLSLSLRIWGESLRANKFAINSNLPEQTIQSVRANVKRLFPEAEITTEGFQRSD